MNWLVMTMLIAYLFLSFFSFRVHIGLLIQMPAIIQQKNHINKVQTNQR